MSMINKQKLCAALIALLGFVGQSTCATAHPHVFIESETQVLLNDKHQITGFHHKWIFDKQYTAFALVGMDVNQDGKYSKEELEPLAKENIESLHEYEFFTFASQNKKQIKLKQPIDAKLTYHNDVLALEFTLPLVTPTEILGNPVRLAIYDPEFFIAFLEPKKQKPVRLASNAPKNCMFEQRRPSMDQSGMVESRLGQPMDLTDETNKGAGAMFAPSFHISCLAKQ